MSELHLIMEQAVLEQSLCWQGLRLSNCEQGMDIQAEDGMSMKAYQRSCTLLRAYITRAMETRGGELPVRLTKDDFPADVRRQGLFWVWFHHFVSEKEAQRKIVAFYHGFASASDGYKEMEDKLKKQLPVPLAQKVWEGMLVARWEEGDLAEHAVAIPAAPKWSQDELEELKQYLLQMGHVLDRKTAV